jgi:hypothetical protein
MIQGIAFVRHQLGSFVGVFGGVILFDTLGSYDLAWKLTVGMGLTAGLVQLSFALVRPLRRNLATSLKPASLLSIRHWVGADGSTARAGDVRGHRLVLLIPTILRSQAPAPVSGVLISSTLPWA